MLSMNLQWPDPISFVADIVTIVGVPLLAISFRTIFKEWRYDREHNTVSMGCLEFYNVDLRCGVNLVPLKSVQGCHGSETKFAFQARRMTANDMEPVNIGSSGLRSVMRKRPRSTNRVRRSR
jgi:hypothetical protein